MTRPTLEVADILRAQGDRFLERYRSSFGFQQLKAFRAILRCRTAALGGHRDACLRCGKLSKCCRQIFSMETVFSHPAGFDIVYPLGVRVDGAFGDF